MSTDSVAPLTGQHSPAFCSAVVARAEYVADLVGEAFAQTENNDGNVRSGNVVLPRESLLDFGALLQLNVWEMQGIRRHRELGLPSVSEAASEFADKVQCGLDGGKTPEFGHLASEVLRVTMDEFCWDALPAFGFDIPITAGDVDQLLDVVAKYLYESCNSGSCDGGLK